MMAAILGLLLLLLSANFSAHADESIDCGTSDVYSDENSIIWTGDDTLISNGESQDVKSSKVLPRAMSTLRVFKTRNKNCYSIQADKGAQVLVRASFFYGNYDGKSAPPTFDLQFDGNYWVTVETSSDDIVYYEVIYVVKGDVISVCVAQTKPNQFPFMSALEVRSLGSHMYSHVDSEYALFLKKRVAYGSTESIRSTDDAYDRIWNPEVVDNGLVTARSDAILIDVSVEDNPPQSAVQNAITSSSTSEPINLVTDISVAQASIYMTMYFSEVTELDSTQTRSFELYVDNKSESNPILPPYGSVNEMYISNITASKSTSFSLVSTTGSTLPPLINAMELFYISDPLTDGTNSKDVDGLVSLQNEFSGLQDWGGDPCLPSPYTWDWVNCSTGATPRVTALYLSSFDLNGLLPDFSSMDALQTIELHNNSLTGPIPDFLGKLPNLKTLNLADNGFSGPVPISLSGNTKLKLVISGNPDLCTSGKSCQTTSTGTETTSSSSSTGGGKKKSKLPVILGTTIPSFLVFWAIVAVLSILHQRRKIAALNAVGPGGTNRPNGGTQQQSPMNGLASKIGESVMNEIKVNIQDQVDQQQVGQQHGSNN